MILTARQLQIILFIQGYLKRHGFPPTLRDIGHEFKIAPSSVFDHLKALEKKGYIRRLEHKPRCLEVLKRIQEEEEKG